MTFGDKLRFLRKEKKITQTDMAKIFEISPRAYQNYEEGKTYPKDSSLYFKMAKYFNVSVDFLIDESQFPLDGIEMNCRDRMRRIVQATEALYNSGELTKDDEDLLHIRLQQVYDRARRKREWTF